MGWRWEEPSGIVVGWGGYAEYRVGLEPEPHAEATIGPIPSLEASVAFILSVLPLTLPLFDIEPLHGSAVSIGEGALLLLGSAGAGKSSIAAALDWLGFSLLTDDACAVDEAGKLWPGPPMLNPRWSDARQPVIGTYNGKSIRAPNAHSPEPREVTGVLSLIPQRGVEPKVRELSAEETLVNVLGNVRGADVFTTRRRPLQLKVAAMLSGLPTGALGYDPERQGFDQVAEVVAEWGRTSRVGTA